MVIVPWFLANFRIEHLRGGLCAAFSGYLGAENKDEWKQYDATELLKAYSGRKMPILCDTGTADGFLEVRLPHASVVRL